MDFCARIRDERKKWSLDDPLLAFTQEMKSRKLNRFSETVNLASLFTCRAALAEFTDSPLEVANRLDQRIANANRVRALAAQLGWKVLPSLLPSGIVMLQASRTTVREAEPTCVREYFALLNVSVSTYQQGVIRLSMPLQPLHHGDLDLLTWALKRCDPYKSLPPALTDHESIRHQLTTTTSSNGLA